MPDETAAFHFFVLGQERSVGAAKMWLENAGWNATTVTDWKDIPPASESERTIVVLADDGAVSLPKDCPWIVGRWQDSRNGTAAGTSFRLWPDMSPEAAAEIVAVAHRLHRAQADLHTVARRLTHDLMSPVGAVVTTADLLSQELAASSPDDHELAQAILSSGRELQQIIDRLSFLLRAAARPLPLADVDMESVVWRVRQRYEYRMKQADCDLQTPSAWTPVRGVPAWLEQVWIEFLENAMRHAGAGRTVSITHASDADTVRYGLRDSGPGVSTDDVGALFVPFHQAAGRGGNRWGLTIVQRLIDLQGGRVGYEPVATGGSEFFFILPRASSGPVA